MSNERAEKINFLRSLTPRKFSFDGYNAVNVVNKNHIMFFDNNSIKIGEHLIKIDFTDVNNKDCIVINFDEVEYNGRYKISFSPYSLSIDEFYKKLMVAINENRDFIILDISISRIYDMRWNVNCGCIAGVFDKYSPFAISFYVDEMKMACEKYSGLTIKNKFYGGTAMKKNPFGLNFEFGVSKDKNLASTLMGVAVRNPETNSWYTFDVETKTRKNISGLKMGDFPIILIPIPANQVTVGKLLKYGGKYYNVIDVKPNNTFTMIAADDGIIRDIVPEENIIPGMSLFTEVVAFDAKSLTNVTAGESVSKNILSAICMMQWAKGDSEEFSMDKLSDDSFNGLGEFLPLLMINGNMGTGFFGAGNEALTIPLLLSMTSSSSDQGDMMQMMLLSQLLGGGGAISNPFSSILPSPIPAQSEDVAPKVKCTSCSLTYPEGTNFCPKCGGKTEKISDSAFCSKCGAKLQNDAMFCHKCGAKVEGESICSKCGKHLKPEDVFCPSCGTKKNAALPTEAVSSAKDSDAPKEEKAEDKS